MSSKRFYIPNLSLHLAKLLCCVALLLAACAPVDQPRWELAPDSTPSAGAAPQEALAGGEFNQFFPKDHDQFDVVYTQEKLGFAEALLRADGQDVATLAIFDIISNPAAAEKYAQSSETVAGYPAARVGSNGTAILVADRFQVQVRSLQADFSADDRAEWLAAFDLAGLAVLR